MAEVFSGIADVIARMNPGEVVGLKAPEQMSVRMEQLVNKRKQGVFRNLNPMNRSNFWHWTCPLA